MPMMNEAMSKSDWERQDSGLPPLKRKVPVRKDPEKPKNTDIIVFKDLPLDRFVRLVDAEPYSIKNKEGVRFIGYNVQFEIKYAEASKKKPEDPQTYFIKGWMPEGEWLTFVRNMRGKVDFSNIQM